MRPTTRSGPASDDRPLGADAGPGLAFSMDRIAMNIHGNADSHVDALCHVIFDGKLYNGVPADIITATGAAELSIVSRPTASSAAGCCWTCRVPAACPGWSRVTT